MEPVCRNVREDEGEEARRGEEWRGVGWGGEAERGFDVMCDDDEQQGPSPVLLLSSLP